MSYGELAGERIKLGLILHDPEEEHDCFSEVTAFSDLLLHDMGAGLADGIRESNATGREWRTAPLWGLGGLLSKEMPLLHDGRAKGATEAILWHGGEAQASKEAFLKLSPQDGAALLRYLGTL